VLSRAAGEVIYVHNHRMR